MSILFLYFIALAFGYILPYIILYLITCINGILERVLSLKAGLDYRYGVDIVAM